MIHNNAGLYVMHALENHKITPNPSVIYISALLVNLVVKK